MIDHAFQEISHSRYGRKILQVNSSSSSSSFDTSQPSFIALLCVITVLTIVLVIAVIFLCYRYYSHRERKSKLQHKHRNKFPRIYQQSPEPVSITPTSASSYSVRSSEHLVSNPHHQNISINTLPSHRLQQSILDAYLNDLNSFQPATIDAKQLNSYLFIDLHSTSSETFPDNFSKQFTNNTRTSGYNTSTEDESQGTHRYYVKHQQRRQSTLRSKRSYGSRFLMRERSLPNNLHKLPQLRQITTQKQRHLFELDDTNNSSTTNMNQDLQSTSISTTTNDYDDSHAYNVNQNQIMKNIKEEKHFSQMPLHYEQVPYCFEIVSTSRDDYSEIQTPYKSSPAIDSRTAYINDSILV